jgi:hypothetical protein
MSVVQRAWRVTRTAISADDWTPVVIPMSCDGFSLASLKGWDWIFRTEIANPDTEKSCGGTTQEIVLATTDDSRFRQADILCWAKSEEGQDAIVATWLGHGN